MSHLRIPDLTTCVVPAVLETEQYKQAVYLHIKKLLQIKGEIDKILEFPSKPQPLKMSTPLSRHSKHSTLRSEGTVKQISKAILKHSKILTSDRACLSFLRSCTIHKQEAEF